ncbi:hypothetical protein [Burkholderia gladioli]|uniref:hypothetical protein n=1 Tax=Burkholderia gladioli TaxID=28095 RepID=UPI000CDB1A4F|nr:hypothetical protein [Burkholderia gladioli]POS07378.1 hypothetical protein C3Y08_15145 [Burkholderia gladioli]
MDYVFDIFVAGFSTLIFSIFTALLASRSRRPIYRKIMWGYVATVPVAGILFSTFQASVDYFAAAVFLSSLLGVFVEVAVAVKLGHLMMVDAPYEGHGTGFGRRSSLADDYTNSWKQTYHGPNDPLRRW